MVSGNGDVSKHHSQPSPGTNKNGDSQHNGISADTLDMRSSLSTPPPGFGLIADSRFHGEKLSISRAAAASAPPTSLFMNGNAGFRSMFDNQIGEDGFTKSRTMSYNNLAEALGEGLAECMGESLNESKHKIKAELLFGSGRTNRSSTNGKDEFDNVDRQNRHSSRRNPSVKNKNHDDPDNSLSCQDPRVTSSKGVLTPHVNTDYSSQAPSAPSSSVSIHPQYNERGNALTVEEPSPCATPALALMNCGVRTDDVSSAIDSSAADTIFAESTQNLLNLNGSRLFQAGRASAPPHLFESQSNRNRVTVRPQQKLLPPSMASKPSRTPIPSFNNVRGKFSGQMPPSSTPTLEMEQILEDPAVKELVSFVWEENKSDNGKAMYPSRALAIFGLAGLQLSEVKPTLEAFGSLLYLRSECFASKGVLMIAYHDLRSSRHAAGELKVYLQQMIDGGGQKTLDIKVMYCLSLTSSSERDDSTLVISNLPTSVREQSVRDLLETTFGALRSVQREPAGCYIVEFFDLQDASQALLEIQSTMPWGASVVVSTKLRQDFERKKGKELFALLGRWRQQNNQIVHAPVSNGRPGPPAAGMHSVPSTISARAPHSPSSQDGQTYSTVSAGQSVAYHPAAQVVIGPDGQYSYIVVQQPQGYPPAQYGNVVPQMQHAQHPVNGHHGQYITGQQHFDGQGYWVQQPHPAIHNAHGASYLPGSSAQSVIPHQAVTNPNQHHPGHPIPAYAPSMTGHSHAVDSSVSSGNTSTGNRTVIPPKQEDSNEHLSLSIQAVKQGLDIRTSLMVRNIPNKYTQSMLLSEFSASGHGPGKIDFFYLPIDFRNKCNRGYAFVNFFNYRDIISFHDNYNGKSWKVFKSEKICCITYARIQGKEGMMKRFQNSALMEKDQAYRPLVFSPNGDVLEENEFST